MGTCWVVEEDSFEGSVPVRICATEALARREKLQMLRQIHREFLDRLAQIRRGEVFLPPGMSIAQVWAYQFEWMWRRRKSLSIQEDVFITE